MDRTCSLPTLMKCQGSSNVAAQSCKPALQHSTDTVGLAVQLAAPQAGLRLPLHVPAGAPGCRSQVGPHQARAPKASMKPKPSGVMSMVVRMAGSNHSASSTYSAWAGRERWVAGSREGWGAAGGTWMGWR